MFVPGKRSRNLHNRPGVFRQRRCFPDGSPADGRLFSGRVLGDQECRHPRRVKKKKSRRMRNRLGGFFGRHVRTARKSSPLPLRKSDHFLFDRIPP
jgi:hypothetical protein